MRVPGGDFARQALAPRIRSFERERISLASLGANISEIQGKTSTAGTEPMDPSVKAMKDALEAIRAMATNA